MKRYINILMVALATMMTSCLTEDPRDQLDEEDIYKVHGTYTRRASSLSFSHCQASPSVCLTV